MPRTIPSRLVVPSGFPKVITVPHGSHANLVRPRMSKCERREFRGWSRIRPTDTHHTTHSTHAPCAHDALIWTVEKTVKPNGDAVAHRLLSLQRCCAGRQALTLHTGACRTNVFACALTDRRMLFPFFNQFEALFRVAMLRSQPVPQVLVS
jgi:hypothetical protein